MGNGRRSEHAIAQPAAATSAWRQVGVFGSRLALLLVVILQALAAADNLVISSSTSVTAGSPFSITVTARTGGATDTAYVGTVTFTSSDGAATLPGDYTFVVGDAGVKTFTLGVTLITAGSRTVTVTDTGNLLTDDQTITVEPAAASSLTLTGMPGSLTAGTASTVVVTAHDVHGNVATGYTGTVAFSSTDASATLPADYTFVVGDNGVRTFTSGVTLVTAGSRTVTVTDAGNALSDDQTTTVNPAAAASLTLTGMPGTLTAGTASTVVVTARDTHGNVATGYTGTVAFSSTDASATLPADYTFVGGDNGVRTFTAGVTLVTAGSRTVTVTDAGNALNDDQATTVNAGAATTLAIGTAPAGATAGIAFAPQPVIRIHDAHGNLVDDDTTTVTVALTTGTPGKFTGTKTRTAANGIATFTDLAHDKNESIVMRFSSSPSLAMASTGSIPVGSGTAVRLEVTGFPGSQTAGVSGTVTVTAFDVGDNIATGYTGTIAFTSNDGSATLPTSYTFVGGDNGARTFTNGVALVTAGTRTITATDTVTASITGTQAGITITPAALHHFLVNGLATPVVAGVSGSVTVRARDQYNNTVTAYTGTVEFLASDAQADLPADYTFVVGDNGVHTFTGGVVLKTAGTHSVTARDTVTPANSGSQNGIQVTPAAASALTVAGLGSPRTAGVAGSLTVTARDAYGNTATGYVGTVHLTSSDAQAGLPADYTFLVGDNGVRTFTNGVTLRTAALQSVTVTDTVSGSITGSQSGIDVRPAAAAILQVSGFPSPQVAGIAGSVTVTARDAFNNTATGYTGTVHFTSNDVLATLPADYTFLVGDNGVRTFTSGVALRTSGTATISATDTVSGSITGNQSAIDVTPATAVGLVFSTQAGGATAGAVFTTQPVVRSRDAFGNPSSVGLGVSVPLTLSLSAGNGVLAGTTSINIGTGGTAGVATFTDLRIDDASAPDKVLSASATLNGSPVILAGNAFDVLPDVAHHLEIVTQPPANVPAGSTFAPAPVVRILDQFDNLRNADTLAIVATRNPGTGSGTLQGTTTVAAVGGVATFTALNHQVAGVIAIDFTSGALAVTSGTVTVGAATASAFRLTGSAIQVAGSANTITVTAIDLYGNPAGYAGMAALTFSNAGDSPGPVSRPTVDDQSTAPIAFGSATNLLFTNGVASAPMRLYRAEQCDIAVSDGVLSASGANRLSVTVTAASAARLVVTGPASLTAGAVGDLTITAADPYGNTDATYIGQHALTFSGPGPSTNPVTVPTVEDHLGTQVEFGDPTTLTFTAGVSTVAGAANGRVRLFQAGSTIIAVSDGTLASASGDRLAVTVGHGAADHLVVSGAATQVAGQTQDIAVTIEDPYGNVVLSENTTRAVTLSATGAGGGFNAVGNQPRLSRTGDGVEVDLGTATPLLFQAGVASVLADPLQTRLRLVRTGSASLTATAGALVASTPLVVTVGAGAPATLRVAAIGNPTPVAGVANTLDVVVEDVGGNQVPVAAQVDLLLSATPTPGSLRAGATNLAIAAGSSSTTIGNLRLDRAESGVVMTVSDAATLLTAASTTALTVQNDQPGLTIGSGVLTYAGGSGAIPFGSPGIGVSDINSAGFAPYFDGATITVSIIAGAVPSEDLLQVRSAGAIRVSGTTVYWTATNAAIATLSGGIGGAPLVVGIDQPGVDAPKVAALLENLCYRNLNGVSPTTGDRTLQLDFSDGTVATPGPLSAVPVTRVVQVVDGNALPVLLVNTGLSVTRGSTTTITDTNLRASDDESGEADLRFTIVTFPSEGDLLLGSGPSAVTLVAGGIDSFTQQDLDGDLVHYRHGGGSQPGDSFSFVLGDGTNLLPATTFSITLAGAGSNPVLFLPLTTLTTSEPLTPLTTVVPTVIEPGAPFSFGTQVSDPDTFDFANGTVTIEVVDGDGNPAADPADEISLRSQSVGGLPIYPGYATEIDYTGFIALVGSDVVHRQYPFYFYWLNGSGFVPYPAPPGGLPFPSLLPSGAYPDTWYWGFPVPLDLVAATLDPTLDGMGGALRLNLGTGAGALGDPVVSAQAVARMIGNVGFRNRSQNPPTADRWLRITLAEAAPSTAAGVAAVRLVIVPDNDAPEFAIPAIGQTFQAMAGIPMRVRVLATDVDLPADAALSYALTSVAPASAGVATLSASSGALEFTALPTFSGPVTLTVRATDDQGVTTSAAVMVNVLAGPTDQGPLVVSDPPFEGFAGETLSYPLVIRPDPALATPVSVHAELVGDVPDGALLTATADPLRPHLGVTTLVRPGDGVCTFGIRITIDHGSDGVRIGYQPVTFKIRAVGATN